MIEFIRGLVRPILTVGGFGVVSYAALKGVIPWEPYLQMVGMMVAFWFAIRKAGSSS